MNGQLTGIEMNEALARIHEEDLDRPFLLYLIRQIESGAVKAQIEKHSKDK